ncbi:MAG: thioredoxin domain-containing protein [Archangiaceae bacterium]|nr:thioredoxin domain-containing protein [Archangiaceae bacterium]
MTNPLRSAFFAVSIAFALVGCKNENGGGTKAPPAAQVQLVSAENPDTVLAKLNGKEIKLKEVDDVVGAKIKELDKQKFETRKQGLEQLIVQSLVKDAAGKEGKTEEQFLKANIDEKLPPPPDAEIAKVFEENKSQMPPGSTLESMRPQIIGFLQQEQKRQIAMKLFGDLRAKAQVQVLLSEPRVTVEAKGPAKGASEAKVTIVEFSDFQCPFCSKAEPSVDEVMKNYSDKVKVVFRHFPLDFHEKAFKAAEGAACAEEQGKFWEFHKTLFANQGAIDVNDLKTHAKTLGLDTGKFNDCLDNGKMRAKVDADMAAGRAVGVNGTPAFFINGIAISGAQPYEKFKEIIDSELAK